MLTLREEEVLQKLWEHGPMSVRQLVELYPEPQPHVNTVSTVVRTLEAKDFVGHESNGQGFVYFAKIVLIDQPFQYRHLLIRVCRMPPCAGNETSCPQSAGYKPYDQ